jgi:hypothetical protein
MAGEAMKLIRQWFVFSVLVYACIVFYPARLMVAQGVDFSLILIGVLVGALATGVISVAALAFCEGLHNKND